MTEELHYVQGDTGPNPVFGLQNVSATAGATARSLASLATAYMRFGAYPTPATAYLVPATVAAGADATLGLVEAYVASVQGLFASAGRYEAQLVLKGPWGTETWPRDDPYIVIIRPRLGGL